MLPDPETDATAFILCSRKHPEYSVFESELNQFCFQEQQAVFASY